MGVADEGPAYIQRKEYAEDEVFALDEGDVFGTFRVPIFFLFGQLKQYQCVYRQTWTPNPYISKESA